MLECTLWKWCWVCLHTISWLVRLTQISPFAGKLVIKFTVFTAGFAFSPSLQGGESGHLFQVVCTLMEIFRSFICNSFYFSGTSGFDVINAFLRCSKSSPGNRDSCNNARKNVTYDHYFEKRKTPRFSPSNFQ